MSTNSLFPATGRRFAPEPPQPPQRSRSPESTHAHAGRLLAAALGFLLALGLTCLVFVWTRGGQQVDGALLPRAQRGGDYVQRTTLVEPAKAALAFFGDPAVLAVLLAAVLLTGALGRRPWAGVAGVGVVLGGVATAGILKLVIPRPELEVGGSTTHNSFPSGHVAAAVGLLFAFLLVLPVRARWWLAVPGAAATTVVASATMIVGWHRFSDTVGGVLLAATLCCLAAAALPNRPDVSRVDVRRRDRVVAVGLIVLAGPLPVVVAAASLSVGDGLFLAIVLANAFTVLTVTSVVLLTHSADFVSRAPTAEPGR